MAHATVAVLKNRKKVLRSFAGRDAGAYEVIDPAEQVGGLSRIKDGESLPPAAPVPSTGLVDQDAEANAEVTVGSPEGTDTPGADTPTESAPEAPTPLLPETREKEDDEDKSLPQVTEPEAVDPPEAGPEAFEEPSFVSRRRRG